MKLLILTSSFPFHKGDYHGNFVYFHALGQVKIGNEVHIVCPHIPDTPFEETIDGIIIHRFPYFYPYQLQKIASNTGLYSGLKNSKLAVLQVPLFFVFEFYYANKIISKYHIDLIHSHWIVPQGLIGSVCKRIWKIPHVISSHVLDANLFGKYRMSIPLLSTIVSNADLVSTDSTYNKKTIENLVDLKKPCEVIPMGVNIQEKPPLPQSRQKQIILFVGRLIEWKGVDLLIKAMVEVRQALPDAMLYIVGEGPSRDNLIQLAGSSGLAENVKFLGRIDDDKLEEMYGSASVHVLPSRQYNGLVMEGLGVVLLEAMSHGVPVIGSNTGGITDIIQDRQNGFLFPSDDEKVLAQKIVELLTNGFLADQFRERGYETVRTKFSWPAISERFEATYREVRKKYQNNPDTGRP